MLTGARAVFVLQLDGRKHWRLYHTPVAHPFTGQKVGREVQGQPATGSTAIPRAPVHISLATIIQNKQGALE